MSIVRQTVLTMLATLGLHAAILDDLVEEVSHYTTHHSHKRHRHVHRQHYVHALSKERQWQYALQFLGYYHGPINGDLLTPESYHAIEEFQFAHQALATGFLDNRYKPYLSDIYRQITLQHDIVYSGKVKDRIIRKKQAALSVLGYYNGTIDGKFGSKSKEAWKHAITALQDEQILFDHARKDVEERLQKMKDPHYFSRHYSDEASQSGEVSL